FRMVQDAVHKERRFITNFCVGGTAAAVSKTIVSPIERVKLLLQVQNTYAGTRSRQRYKGILDTLIRVPKEQGILSFWRGNGTNVLRYFPTQALNFAFNDLFRSRLVREFEEQGSLSYLVRSMASGGLAGCTTICFVYPLDLIRTRIAVDIGENVERREYKGIIDCARKTIESDGIRGLYRGFFISVQLYFLYRSLYFGLYDTMRGVYEQGSNGSEKRTPNFFVSFLLAEVVTVCASYSTYPWDSVRRRMMVKGDLSKASSIDAVKKIVQSEGFLGLYKGVFANLLRCTGSALVMALYHEIQTYYR
ncbi:hypothetical protein PMAYCL1PPCAC_14100, partial [Pristionchus mayeri]